jgi:hypothetical protein
MQQDIKQARPSNEAILTTSLTILRGGKPKEESCVLSDESD